VIHSAKTSYSPTSFIRVQSRVGAARTGRSCHVAAAVSLAAGIVVSLATGHATGLVAIPATGLVAIPAADQTVNLEKTKDAKNPGADPHPEILDALGLILDRDTIALKY